MASKEPPLDEISWRNPGFLQAYGIHTNSVLFYFRESPFFDPTSNNAVIYSQAVNNKMMEHLLHTRESFEGRLKSMSGLEFIVVQEPAETAPGMGTGVWVIRKQTRKKRYGEEDEITPHATYFVAGEDIFMAPTLGDVLNQRMLSMFSSMNKFISVAEALPNFSPALGHTYLPPTSNRRKGTEAQPGQLSRESTPMPGSLVTPKKDSTLSTSTYLGNRLLEESFLISSRYNDEYMDEHPVTGQPGDFHLATKTANKLMVPPTITKGPLTVPPKPTPSPLKTDIPPATRKDNKSSKSPKTPGTASGVPKPKRRKSKAPGSGLASPT